MLSLNVLSEGKGIRAMNMGVRGGGRQEQTQPGSRIVQMNGMSCSSHSFLTLFLPLTLLIYCFALTTFILFTVRSKNSKRAERVK